MARASATIRRPPAWCCGSTSSERGVTGAVLGGHRVSLGTAKTYSVDRRRLAELVAPEIRLRVLSERETTRLTVSHQAGRNREPYPRATIQAALGRGQAVRGIEHCDDLTPADRTAPASGTVPRTTRPGARAVCQDSAA